MPKVIASHAVELYRERWVDVALLDNGSKPPTVRLRVNGDEVEPGVMRLDELRAAWVWAREAAGKSAFTIQATRRRSRSSKAGPVAAVGSN